MVPLGQVIFPFIFFVAGPPKTPFNKTTELNSTLAWLKFTTASSTCVVLAAKGPLILNVKAVLNFIVPVLLKVLEAPNDWLLPLKASMPFKPLKRNDPE